MDFGGMFQTWINVLTKPNEQTFEEELAQPSAKLSTAIIWIIIAAVISAIFSVIGALVAGALGMGGGMMEMALSQADLPPEVMDQMMMATAGSIGGSVVGAFCGALIMAPIGFLIGSGIYWIIAKLFGGEGSYEMQSFALATFTAPMLIVTSVINVVPILGGCVAFFIWIYQLFLTYLALKVSHKLTSGKAVLVILIPIIILSICAFCGIFAFITTIMTAVAGAGMEY